MVAIIIGTHGNFSEELVKSSEMIFGQQENVGYVTFKPGEGSDDLMDKYTELLNKLDTEDGVLFLVDLFGGSPFNAASRIAIGKENMDIITGVNLPMLLEVYGSRSFSNLQELVNIAKNSGVESIKAFKEIMNSQEEDDL